MLWALSSLPPSPFQLDPSPRGAVRQIVMRREEERALSTMCVCVCSSGLDTEFVYVRDMQWHSSMRRKKEEGMLDGMVVVWYYCTRTIVMLSKRMESSFSLWLVWYTCEISLSFVLKCSYTCH